MTKNHKLKIYKHNFGIDEFTENNTQVPNFLEMEKFYEQLDVHVVEQNQIVPSIFIGKTNDHLLFEASLKDYIRVENKSAEAKYLINTNIGDKVDVLIVEVNNNNFLIKGSIASIYESRAHKTLLSLEEGESVTAFVKSWNPAGYTMEISYEGITLSGFMPNTLAGINKLYSPELIIGKTMQVMIESFSRDEGTYIVSRRRYLQSLISEEVKNLETGRVYSGNVTGTTPFGVFIEFNGCLTGMIHKTNLNPDWQEKINEITPGFEIDFYVKEIIKDKIILTQILRESLWDIIKVGQVLSGKVKDNKQFGSLIYLDNETIGLIQNPSKSLSIGEEVKVKVTLVDRQNRKIFLSQN
jgi:ribosomal protein S1